MNTLQPRNQRLNTVWTQRPLQPFGSFQKSAVPDNVSS